MVLRNGIGRVNDEITVYDKWVDPKKVQMQTFLFVREKKRKRLRSNYLSYNSRSSSTIN
jgi:hypothetical protein